jgi:hypothetical protein
MRNLKLAGLMIIIGIYSSCDKDEDLNGQVLSGIYNETSPFSGTHQLNFANDNTLILKARNSTDEQFTYQIIDNTIKLNPSWESSQTWELEINIINNSKFEIQNIFYASIPEDENPIQIVTFEK